MDIKVGAVPPLVGAPEKKGVGPSQFVEARLLAVRAPRRRGAAPPVSGHERRERPQPPDPASGRVLILLIPDAQQLPEGLDQGQYRVFLRFAKK